MKFNFEKLSKNDFKKIKFNEYDFVIIGSGPSATVLLNELIKRKKKILIIEKGNFSEKKYKEIKSIDFKIKKNSRTFGVGGTSQDWSNISSYFEKIELLNNETKKNIWPLNHSDLLKYYKNLYNKFGFGFKKLNKKYLKVPFKLRKFIANTRPKNFKFFHTATDYDLLYNANIDYIDEKNNSVKLHISSKSIKKTCIVKNITLCNGGIESIALILKSLKRGMLKKLKNKKYVGRYFMDHPKCYVGNIIYPKKKILEQLELKYNKNLISYYGISLNENDQKNYNFLNSYIRFERQNKKLSSVFNFIEKNLDKTFRKLINFKNKEIYSMRLFFEMEPIFNNRIIIDDKEHVICRLKVSKREKNTVNFLLKKINAFLSEKPNEEKINTFAKFENKLEGASHHMGGLCYPKIVNKNLKFNGLKNIYCCSSSIFPTSGSVNPTMTICALALRLSEHLNKKYLF